jgi:Ca2+-transporting ATPase
MEYGRGKKSHWNRNVGKRACTFDPMEKRYTRVKTTTNDTQTIFHDSWISSRRKPPMMTHVFENKEGKRIIAAKAVQKRL